MSFTAFNFMIFFPLAAAIYLLIPDRVKKIWLIIASFFFYMSAAPIYGLVLLFIILISYTGGLIIREKKWGVLLIPICLLPLIVFKYSSFAVQNLNIIASVLRQGGFTLPQIIQPLGISFYTFEAVSYLADVYKGKTEKERNFLNLALYISFFPTVLSGPIERSSSLIPQFDMKHRFNAERVKNGLLTMLWGYFLKLVLSERLAGYVNKIFDDYKNYGGLYIVVAIIFFSLQIYFDFQSYSLMAYGAAEIMGFEIKRNFRQPYLAVSVADFWRRWHISLTSWFRDYIYISLGGNRKGNLRKYLNILVVFFISGLWHGASWNFVFWGLLNGVYQVIGSALQPFRDKAVEIFALRRETFSHRIMKTVVTFCLVALAWTFFKAESLMSGLRLLSAAAVWNPWIFFDGKFISCFSEAADLWIIIGGLFIAFVTDCYNEKKGSLIEAIDRQELWFRWGFYIIAVLTVLILGKYGPGYNSSEFIYFKF